MRISAPSRARSSCATAAPSASRIARAGHQSHHEIARAFLHDLRLADRAAPLEDRVEAAHAPSVRRDDQVVEAPAELLDHREGAPAAAAEAAEGGDVADPVAQQREGVVA